MGAAVLALIAAVAAAIALVFWLLVLIGILGFRRDHHTVRLRSDDRRATQGVRVSVVLPAHDEALVLDACLRSLLAQTHAPMEVIVVDDRSTDGTGAIARRFAAADNRVRVVRVDVLPPGWTGKTHALTRGVAAAGGEWLLFTDADTIHDPGALAACLRRALAQRVVLLSGWPAAVVRSWIGAWTDPLCGAVLASWNQRRGASAQRRFAPFANGQYLLVHRDAFEQVGGFEAIRQRLLEDIALAGLMDREGLPFETVLLSDVLRVRTYAGFRAGLQGWSRIFLHGAAGNLRRLIRRAAALPVPSLAGYAALAVGLAAPPAPIASLAWVLGALCVAAMTLATALVYHQVRVPKVCALLAPLPAMLTALFLATAARDGWRMRPVEWHGVRYPGGVR